MTGKKGSRGKMSKRFGAEFEDSFSKAPKRPKLEVTVTREPDRVPKTAEKKDVKKSDKNDEPFDDWGDVIDDFAEIDLIASQAYADESTKKTEPPVPKVTKLIAPQPSTSSSRSNGSTLSKTKNYPSTSNKTSRQSAAKPLQRVASCDSYMIKNPSPTSISSQGNTNRTQIKDTTVNFRDFENKMLNNPGLNSTFQANNAALDGNKTLVDQPNLRLQGENKYLREQLDKMKTELTTEKQQSLHYKNEQEKKFQDQTNKFKKELSNLGENLKSKEFEIQKMSEKNKLLESNTVKYIEPCTASNLPMNRASLLSAMNQTYRSKAAATSEVSVQTMKCDKSIYKVSPNHDVYPLKNIPNSISEAPQLEKSILDNQILEISCKRKLSILQHEQTTRIFQNPEILKPLVTMVDDKKLNMQFVLADLYEIQGKTYNELNSTDIIPTYNKVITMCKELLLNTTIVLQKISHAMNNDDIRDMDDLYCSHFSKLQHDYNRNICDASPWYSEERGIETRRAVAALAYLAKASNYVSQYIAGKSPLIVKNDKSYERYIKQMNSYNSWEKKNSPLEFLELILDFSNAMNFVRRAHQFSGLIFAIAKLLCNVQKTVGLSLEGLDCVYRIFKALVFSRPLPFCFIALTKMMTVFCRNPDFDTLCSSKTEKNAPCKHVSHAGCFRKNNELLFHSRSCVLFIFVQQLEKYDIDPIATIRIAHMALSYIQSALRGKAPCKTEVWQKCDCCMTLLRQTMYLFYKSIGIDVANLQSLERHRVKQGSSEPGKKEFTGFANLSDQVISKVCKKQENLKLIGNRFLFMLVHQCFATSSNERIIDEYFHICAQLVNKNGSIGIHQTDDMISNHLRNTLAPEKTIGNKQRIKVSLGSPKKTNCNPKQNIAAYKTLKATNKK